MSLAVKLWGTRGSLPAPHRPAHVEERARDLLRGFFDSGYRDAADVEPYLQSQPVHAVGGFGGNTMCVEVRSPRRQLIIDGGSGLRDLGYALAGGPCGSGQGEVHILFTHVHWDHLLGLPFFVPVFVPGNRIHLYSVTHDLEEMMQTVFQRPFFPVPYEDLAAELVYHRLEPRQTVAFDDVDVTPYRLDHPDESWGFRMECGGRAFAHCVDTECTRVSPEEIGPDLPLYQDANLMIFDAQYTLIEKLEKVDWGHASAASGIDIAMRERVERVVFVHNDPAASDQKIAAVVAEAQRYYEMKLRWARGAGQPYHKIRWHFGVEGDEFDV